MKVHVKWVMQTSNLEDLFHVYNDDTLVELMWSFEGKWFKCAPGADAEVSEVLRSAPT